MAVSAIENVNFVNIFSTRLKRPLVISFEASIPFDTLPTVNPTDFVKSLNSGQIWTLPDRIRLYFFQKPNLIMTQFFLFWSLGVRF